MSPWLIAILITAGFFALFLSGLEIGYRFGTKSADKERHGVAVIEGAVFGLLGLLLAFSFGTGIAHFDQRRLLVVTEADAIGTAYRRVDLLPAADQPQMRRLLGSYADARVAVYENPSGMEVGTDPFHASDVAADQIWQFATREWNTPSRPQATQFFVLALNDMFARATDRKVALSSHNPALVFVLLIVVGFLSCIIGGYSLSARGCRSGLHMAVYALTLALTIYTVLDLDYPRFGLIRINAADQALLEVRDRIQAQAHPGATLTHP